MTQRLAVASLAVVAVLLAAFNVAILWELTAEPAPLPPVTPADAAGAAIAVGPGDAAVQRRSAPFPVTGAAVRRPLFWPDRSGTVRPAPAIARSSETRADGWRLAGSYVDSSGVHNALIVSPDDPKGVWIAVGDTYRGWRLVTLDAHAAEVEAGSRRIELNMFEAATLRR